MSTTHEHRAELFMLMQLRLLGFGRNPLRRRVDRLEAVLLMVALTVASLVIPAAAAFGTAIRDRAEHAAAQERAHTRAVVARTLEDSDEAALLSPGLTTTRVRVGWFDASGSAREDRADVLIGTKSGSELTIWLDPDGKVTRAPRPPSDSAALGVVAGMGMAVLAWPLLIVVVRLARRPLDHHRAEEWAREWREVSPRWTRQLP
jgi:hypothetical protein